MSESHKYSTENRLSRYTTTTGPFRWHSIVVAVDGNAFAEWKDAFDVRAHQPEISNLLVTCSWIRTLHAQLVRGMTSIILWVYPSFVCVCVCMSVHACVYVLLCLDPGSGIVRVILAAVLLQGPATRAGRFDISGWWAWTSNASFHSANALPSTATTIECHRNGPVVVV